MSEVLIEAHELSKWFGEVVALNNLTVTIGTGVTGLLGSNGAGKSTFIKLALGLYAPSRGRISVLGGAPRNNPRVLERIGYCPEVDNFYDGMSGYEFVFWLSRQWGMDRNAAHKATLDAIERVKMTERMDDLIDEYSKGMRQRMKLAQALAVKPDLLFLDEPMNGLDPQGREEIYQLIRDLNAEGRSVVVSSHILHEVEKITDNVVLLYNGSMLAQGRVREIRDLIDQHPHTITVKTAAPRELVKEFVDDHAIIDIVFEPETLILRTRDPNGCYQRLNELARAGVAFESVTCADDNLQSVFDYLVR